MFFYPIKPGGVCVCVCVCGGGGGGGVPRSKFKCKLFLNNLWFEPKTL